MGHALRSNPAVSGPVHELIAANPPLCKSAVSQQRLVETLARKFVPRGFRQTGLYRSLLLSPLV